MCFVGFFVREHPKAQPAVVLVLKRLRKRGNGLSRILNILGEPGIDLRTLGHKATTSRWFCYMNCKINRKVY